jgi:hypothetical protein
MSKRKRMTLKQMLLELEFIDGDDMRLPACRFCDACGPDNNPAHPRPAAQHDSDCPLAIALGRPMKKAKQ